MGSVCYAVGDGSAVDFKNPENNGKQLEQKGNNYREYKMRRKIKLINNETLFVCTSAHCLLVCLCQLMLNE